MTKINAVSQLAFAEKSGISYYQVSRLVTLGTLKPAARIGERLFFNPDDAEAAAAAVKQSANETEAKYRPEWERLTAKERTSYGAFSAFVAFKKNESRVNVSDNGKVTRAVCGGVR